MARQLKMLAYRENPMTNDEVAKFVSLTQAYWRDYPDQDKYAGPGSYLEDDGPVYAAQLPVPEAQEEAVPYLQYWLTWLTDLTRALPGARWSVEMDGQPLGWDEQAGWSITLD